MESKALYCYSLNEDLGILMTHLLFKIFFREMLVPFLLHLLFLQVACGDQTKGNSYFGLVIS